MSDSTKLPADFPKDNFQSPEQVVATVKFWMQSVRGEVSDISYNDLFTNPINKDENVYVTCTDERDVTDYPERGEGKEFIRIPGGAVGLIHILEDATSKREQKCKHDYLFHKFSYCGTPSLP